MIVFISLRKHVHAIYRDFLKVFGRFHRFPDQSLSVSDSFCVICIENMLHSP